METVAGENQHKRQKQFQGLEDKLAFAITEFQGLKNETKNVTDQLKNDLVNAITEQ